MANTLKTTQGEILISEVEAIYTDTNGLTAIGRNPANTKVVAVGRTGIKYDLTSAISAAQAQKVLQAALNFVAGTGHAVFNPAEVK